MGFERGDTDCKIPRMCPFPKCAWFEEGFDDFVCGFVFERIWPGFYNVVYEKEFFVDL
jgi:hypothetical protein